MKKQIWVLSLVFAFVISAWQCGVHVHAEANGNHKDTQIEEMSFEEAFLQSSASQKYKLSMQTDKFDLTEAKLGTNSLEFYYDLLDEYGLSVGYEKKFRHDIIRKTSYKKAQIGNEIKASGNMLERNSKEKAYRKLYLGVLKASYDVQIAYDKLNIANKRLNAQQALQDSGKSTQLELDIAKNNVEKVKNELKDCEIEYEKLKKLLHYYLGANIKVEAETLITTQLQPVEYYLSLVDNRFEILSRRKQNEMIELEMDIYKSKNLSGHLKDELIEKDRNYRRNESEIQIQSILISDEITKGYADLLSKMRNVESFSEKLNNLKIRKHSIQTLYDTGKISQIMYMEFNVKFSEAQDAYNLMVMDYNNSYRAFMQAVSVGPKL